MVDDTWQHTSVAIPIHPLSLTQHYKLNIKHFLTFTKTLP